MTSKEKALHAFWSSFGLPAYDQYTVPTGEEAPEFPYITYTVQTDSIGSTVSIEGDLWYYGTSWNEISAKADEIAQRLQNMHPPTIQLDHGRLFLNPGTPFAQRMSDPDNDMVRRIYLNLTAEYFTAY